jgi:hypothetical protein
MPLYMLLPSLSLLRSLMPSYATLTRPLHVQGGYTAHLDLDTGTLKGLEAAAGDFTTHRARGGFDDAAPHMPSILAAQMDRQRGRAQTQALAGLSGNKNDMAKEGMRTQDYEGLTDAAGSFD